MDEQQTEVYVRRFIAGLAERAAEAGDGTMSREEAIATDKRACIDGAALFLREDPGIADRIHTALADYYERPSDAVTRDLIVADAFALCARQAYEAITFHSEHDYGAEALQDDLVGLADVFTWFLTGKPEMFVREVGVLIRSSA